MDDREEFRRIAINFELNIQALRENYSKLHPKGAYRRLGRFFHENGFEHRQGSGYVSVEPISIYQLLELTEKLFNTFSWLDKCSTRIDATEVGRVYDLRDLHDKGAFVPPSLMRKRQHSEAKDNRISIFDMLQEIKQQYPEQERTDDSGLMFDDQIQKNGSETECDER